jgi:hypothetical protein
MGLDCIFRLKMLSSNSKCSLTFNAKKLLFFNNMSQATTPVARATVAANIKVASSPNKAKAAVNGQAGKASIVEHGARFKDFCSKCDKDPNIKAKMQEWIDGLSNTETRKTSTGKSHRVKRAQGQFLEDLRLNLPKEKGLRDLMQKQGFTPEKVTLTWAVCYANNIKVDETKTGWERFECSHICCEIEQGGTRMTDARCIDPNCLVWESKSANQSRATCPRKKCHCGCEMTICATNDLHKPPCH